MLFNVKRLYAADNGTLSLGDFGDVESKTLVEKKIFATIKAKPGRWVSRCHEVDLPAPYKQAIYRMRVQEKVIDSDNFILEEGVKPSPDGKLAYVELKKSTKAYGRYQEYTDEMMHYGFDPLVPDLTESMIASGNSLLDNVAAKPWFEGNNVMTFSGTIDRKLINRIRIDLQKFAGTDRQVHCIITPEDMTDLRLKYNDAGGNLFQNLPLNAASVVDATLTKFEGVIFEEDDSDLMYDKANGVRHCLFYVKDAAGRTPVALTAPFGKNAEFIAKALGSSGALDDPLNQKGSVGIKWKGLGAFITAEENLVRVDITPDATGVSGSALFLDTHYDFNNGRIYVEGKEVKRTNQEAIGTSPDKALVISGAASVKAGDTTGITLVVEDTKGNAVAGATLTSSNTKTATVSGYKVSGVAAGTVIITATKDGYVAGTYKLVVKAA